MTIPLRILCYRCAIIHRDALPPGEETHSYLAQFPTKLPTEDDETVLVCPPARPERPPPAIPARPMRCDGCPAWVWVAHSSDWLLEAAGRLDA